MSVHRFFRFYPFVEKKSIFPGGAVCSGIGGADSTGRVAPFAPEWVALISPEYSINILLGLNLPLLPNKSYKKFLNL
jgi:hypothetical protein